MDIGISPPHQRRWHGKVKAKSSMKGMPEQAAKKLRSVPAVYYTKQNKMLTAQQ